MPCAGADDVHDRHWPFIVRVGFIDTDYSEDFLRAPRIFHRRGQTPMKN